MQGGDVRHRCLSPSSVAMRGGEEQRACPLEMLLDTYSVAVLDAATDAATHSGLLDLFFVPIRLYRFCDNEST